MRVGPGRHFPGRDVFWRLKGNMQPDFRAGAPHEGS
jgi:hypothetical protein